MSDLADGLVKALALEHEVRVLLCVSTGIVNNARNIHHTLPAGTAALGRLLTAGLLLGSLLKGDERVNIQITGDGPIGGCIIDADSFGHVRGYLKNPAFELPMKDGELDVTGSFGSRGTLSILKDLGLKQPYIGTVPLNRGSLARNIAYYLTSSEQVPSAVGLSEVFNADGTVQAAGGYLVQALPGADPEVIAEIDIHIQHMLPLSELLVTRDERGIIGEILGGLSFKILISTPVSYTCRCSKEKMEAALITLDQHDLRELAASTEPTEIKCDFCAQLYTFTPEELQKLITIR